MVKAHFRNPKIQKIFITVPSTVTETYIDKKNHRNSLIHFISKSIYKFLRFNTIKVWNMKMTIIYDLNSSEHDTELQSVPINMGF